MRSRRRTTDHQDAVARRLALLSAELTGVRSAPQTPTPEAAAPYSMEPTHTRVRVAAPQPPVPSGPWGPSDELTDELDLEEPEAPPPVPSPGRHASRRVGRTVSAVAGAVPETLRGRVALGPSQLALVAVLVAVGLAVTTWWVVHGEPRQVAAPVPAQPVPGLATPAVAGPPSPVPSPAVAERVTVDVAGKVRRPGIVVLDAGARVVDAIEAAGGARSHVDLSSLNLARVLVDGEQVLVGLPPPVGVSGAAGTTGAASAAPGALVNLNTATAAELESLPEVGPVTAGAIIAWRDEHGGFTAVEELLEVDGIGDATLATITPHVTV